MFKIQVFGRIRAIFETLAIRYVTNVCVLRFRYATSIANCRFLCLSAINANADVGLHSTFLKATIYVNGVVAFIRFAARGLRMLGVASVQLGNDLRRVRKDQSIEVQLRRLATYVIRQ